MRPVATGVARGMITAGLKAGGLGAAAGGVGGEAGAGTDVGTDTVDGALAAAPERVRALLAARGLDGDEEAMTAATRKALAAT